MSEPADEPHRDPFGLSGATIQEKYRITSVVGTGGFGVVYRAVHTGFGEPIAVKCLKLPGELTDKDRDAFMTRLQDEGRVLHRLSKLSNGIVQALDVGSVTNDDGTWIPYLVLEWLEGETLAEYLAGRRQNGEGALSLAEAIELLQPAARALEVAHRQRVAHRDVKPENLYLVKVAGERTIKVLDFGIAKVLAQHATFTAAPAATQKTATAFTPRYGAPEQFNKKRGASGPWTDVFALALIVVEVVAGERALDGDDATQLYIAAADPATRPTLRHHGVETSDAVEEVLACALAIEPADRYQDVGAFWRALCEAAGEKPRLDPAASDVSATGEFVTRHDIDLKPDDLSDGPRSAATRRDGSPAVKPRPIASPEGPASPPPDASPARDRSRTDEVRSLVDETRLPADTYEPKASSSWTLPVVVVLALVGAALVYFELRGIGPTEVENHSSPRPTTRGDGKTTTPSPAGASPAVARGGGGGGAGGHGGGGGSGGAGGGGGSFEPPPEGMSFVPAEEGGFFFDVGEVTVADYRQCVMASRCVPATRIALTPAAARALSVIGEEDQTTPEQLAEAWQPRCNELRQQLAHPVNCVNHASAGDYCRFVGKRLPTSAEWDQAAKGGSRRFPWGDVQPECGTACYGLNSSCVGRASQVATCPAGSHAEDRTPAGIVDLAGNVSEWVADSARKQDPHGPPWRLLRGASFVDEADQLMAARAVPPAAAHVTIGFRCAQDAPDGYAPPPAEEESP